MVVVTTVAAAGGTVVVTTVEAPGGVNTLDGFMAGMGLATTEVCGGEIGLDEVVWTGVLLGRACFMATPRYQSGSLIGSGCVAGSGLGGLALA